LLFGYAMIVARPLGQVLQRDDATDRSSTRASVPT
jgi:hypothetical protein